MTIMASHPLRTIQPTIIFGWGLIAATTIPFISIAASQLSAAAEALAFVLMLIASAHVLGTSYLLTDPEVRQFSLAHPVKMIAIPIGLMFGAFVLFSQATGAILTVAFGSFFVYQAWHFGAQNIGVAAFISLSDRGRSLASFEKTTIKCGIVGGMLGVIQAMSPVFQLDFLGHAGIELGHYAYELGAGMSIPLAAVALWMMVSAFRDRHYRFGIAIALSVCFLFPMYLSHDYLLGYLSITIAHGLQYVIFLFAHANGARPPKQDHVGIAKYSAPLLFVAIFLIANLIWSTDLVKQLPSIGIAIIPALTIPHFWVDLFLWRMKDRERAAWIKSSFAAVLRSNRPVDSTAAQIGI